MKRFVLIVSVLVGFVLTGFSQAKKPIIMVVPSDVWCTQNGYMTPNGPDYKKALQENADLLLVISKIGELMTDRGFPLKTLEASIKKLELDAAEEAAMGYENEEDGVKESYIDQLKKTAKADIWMQLTWTLNQMGPKKSVTFNLQGMDAYTDKQVAAASGTGHPSFSAALPVLLEESVLAHLDNFNIQLQQHFDDLFTNGREMTLRIKVSKAFDSTLESEYDGEELSIIIEDWVAENTVQGRFSTTDVTENQMLMEQVRIPLYDERNRAIDARRWARGLQKMLQDKLQIDCRIMMRGLGEVSLIIGAVKKG